MGKKEFTEFCILYSFIVQKRMGDGSLQTMNYTARNCFYSGIVTNHRFSRVAISMCKGEMVSELFMQVYNKHWVSACRKE